MNDAIEALQSKLALQDESLQALSDELYRQQREIDALKRRLDAAISQLRNQSADSQGAAPVDERPPHY